MSDPEPVSGQASRPGRAARRGWTHFTHGADIGVCGYGPTLEAAFEEGAKALTAVTTHERVEARICIPIRCEAPDAELLFAEWLNALIYEMATRRMLFARFAVHISGTRLTAEAWGEPVDAARHQPAVEVKGATYTALSVARDDDGRWTARCVVDV